MHCFYAETAVVVDWVLRPASTASRPAQSRLSFDKIGIPVGPPPAPESQGFLVAPASEQVTFFWMMAAITAKPYQYPRRSRSPFASTTEEQVKILRQLCEQMLGLMPEAAQLGGVLPLRRWRR